MGYIRVKFGFWALQPVFHVYNLTYLIWPPGIINHDLPEKNKYTNFKNIETIIYSELSDLKKISTSGCNGRFSKNRMKFIKWLSPMAYMLFNQ